MLAAHNSVRAEVKVPPLAWSDQLAALAQDWADTLLARNNSSIARTRLMAKNLFEITGAAASPRQVVNDWAAESRNYDYYSNKCRGVCGHYTQIVWSDTKEVGCAVARSADARSGFATTIRRAIGTASGPGRCSWIPDKMFRQQLRLVRFMS